MPICNICGYRTLTVERFVSHVKDAHENNPTVSLPTVAVEETQAVVRLRHLAEHQSLAVYDADDLLSDIRLLLAERDRLRALTKRMLDFLENPEPTLDESDALGLALQATLREGGQ